MFDHKYSFPAETMCQSPVLPSGTIPETVSVDGYDLQGARKKPIDTPDKLPDNMLGDFPFIVTIVHGFRRKPERDHFMRIAQNIAFGYPENYLVSEEYLDDIFDKTEIAIFKLQPQGNIAKILSLPQDQISLADRENLRENVKALYTCYFKWACHDNFEKATQLIIVSLQDSPSLGTVVSNDTEETLHFSYIGLSQEAIRGYGSNEPIGWYFYCEEFGNLSKMTRIEKEFIKYFKNFPDPDSNEENFKEHPLVQDFKEYIREKLKHPALLEPDFMKYKTEALKILAERRNSAVTDEDFIDYFIPAKCSDIKKSAEEKAKKFLDLWP